MRSVANATGCAPHAEATVRRWICDHRCRELDHDRHVIEAADKVHRLANGPERQRALRDRRERTCLWLPIWKNAEERFEVDEERIVTRTCEELDSVGLDDGVRVTLDLFAADESVHCADAV